MTYQRELKRSARKPSRLMLEFISFMVAFSFIMGLLFEFIACTLMVMEYYYWPTLDRDPDFRLPFCISIIGLLFIVSTWLLDRTYLWYKKELMSAIDADEKSE